AIGEVLFRVTARTVTHSPPVVSGKSGRRRATGRVRSLGVLRGLYLALDDAAGSHPAGLARHTARAAVRAGIVGARLVGPAVGRRRDAGGRSPEPRGRPGYNSLGAAEPSY